MKLDITKTEQTDLDTTIQDFNVEAKTLDGETSTKETEYMNEEWTKQLGYWYSIPELNRAITALAFWTAGKGFTARPFQKVILDHIKGWGEDTFTSIIQNMIKIKKFSEVAITLGIPTA